MADTSFGKCLMWPLALGIAVAVWLCAVSDTLATINLDPFAVGDTRVLTGLSQMGTLASGEDMWNRLHAPECGCTVTITVGPSTDPWFNRNTRVGVTWWEPGTLPSERKVLVKLNAQDLASDPELTLFVIYHELRHADVMLDDSLSPHRKARLHSLLDAHKEALETQFILELPAPIEKLVRKQWNIQQAVAVPDPHAPPGLPAGGLGLY